MDGLSSTLYPYSYESKRVNDLRLRCPYRKKPLESAIIFPANITPTYTTRIWYRFSRLTRKKAGYRLRMSAANGFLRLFHAGK